MAKIRGTRSRQGAGDGWPEAVIRWVRAIGNLKLLRAQSKLFSWTRLGLGRPTPVALARNGPGGSDIGTGEGSDEGDRGAGGAGQRASGSWGCWTKNNQDRCRQRTSRCSPIPIRGWLAAAEMKPTPGPKCNGLTEPGKIRSAQGGPSASQRETGSHRGGQAAAQRAQEGQGADRINSVTVRGDWSRTVREIYAVPIRAWRDGSSIFAFAFRIPPPCSAQSHPPLFE